MKKLLLIIPCILLAQNAHASSFNDSWNRAQKDYCDLYQAIKSQNPNAAVYTGTFWLEVQKKFRALLLGTPNNNILKEQAIQHTMVRTGFSEHQEYEQLFIEFCLSEKTKLLLSSFREADFPGLARECTSLNCSSSSLGYLFYAAKILEASDNPDKIKTIVEFGGGYGGLARIFKQALPQATIVIFDLPETIGLQKLFLDATLPDTRVIIHSTPPDQLEQGAIHLVPMFFMEQMVISADVFVSTFALSESPNYTQQLVINKRFFDASVCYIAGQLNGWGGTFENHDLIMRGVRTFYQRVVCQPFHVQLPSLKNYELVCTLPTLGKSI